MNLKPGPGFPHDPDNVRLKLVPTVTSGKKSPLLLWLFLFLKITSRIHFLYCIVSVCTGGRIQAARTSLIREAVQPKEIKTCPWKSSTKTQKNIFGIFLQILKTVVFEGNWLPRWFISIYPLSLEHFNSELIYYSNQEVGRSSKQDHVKAF